MTAISPQATAPLSLGGLSLRELQYAAAVDRARHFGQAAEQCGVSQAALSEQLRKLENILGGPLFERGYRRVHPTPRGQVLLRQVERILAEARALMDMARTPGEPLAGPLRLGAIATLGPYYLPHVLREARAAFPRLSLLLTESRTASLLDSLRAGTLDCALLALPVPADGMASTALFYEPFHLVCPADHKLAQCLNPTLDNLAGADLILLEEGHCLRDQALGLCGEVTGESRQATSVETLWHMIAAGEGYSLLPALSAAGRDTVGELIVCRPIDDPNAGRTIGLVWRATDPREAEFNALANTLRAGLPPAVREV
jgi:LysR family hydrogen peroxide-inducible transcriptional activator